ncbi:MAG: 4-carboxy-2-hydroxymuconate-6-semialdehyde dehydrogenase [Rhodoglobus sp.]|nr:4-carboxy-2-hydroxymuconate-6-semialdehyde dehydrogenase [Rhodoglobus sp.]
MTEQQEIGIAIVGAGRIAHAHAHAIARTEGVRLLAVVDKDTAVAEAFAARYRAPFATTVLEQALDAPGVDAVIACTPTGMHHNNAMAALQHRKHALIEKPFARNLDEATAMVRAADDAGLMLMSGQVLRFMPMFTWAREFIASGRLGVPVQAVERRLTFRRDNFPWWKDLPNFLVAHWGAHSIDILGHLLDDEIVSVLCEGASVASEFGVVDDFTLHARFGNGVRAAIAMSFTSRLTVHDLVLVGEDATLHFDCYTSVSVNGERMMYQSEEEMMANGFEAQLQAFAAAIRGERPLESSGASVLGSLAALTAAEESMATGEVARPKSVSA